MAFTITSVPSGGAQGGTQALPPKGQFMITKTAQTQSPTPSPAPAPSPAPQAPSQSPLSGLFGAVKSVGGTLADVGVGAAKEVAGQATTGLENIGAKVGNVIGGAISKIPGAPPSVPSQPVQTPDILKQKNTAQQVGGILANLGEFFLPSSAEEAAGLVASGKIDEALNIPKLTEAIGTKGVNIVKGILKTAASGAITGTSMGGVTALQTGGNVQDITNAGLFGAAAGAAGKVVEQVAPGIVKSLIKSDMKLSPTQQVKVGQKAENAAKFIQENDISGTTATKFAKLDNLNQKLEDALQSSMGKDVTASKLSLKMELQNIKNQFVDQPALYNEVSSDVNKAVKTLDKTQGDRITLDSLLSGKRSYGKSAFGKASAQVKGSLVNSEGAYAIEQAYQNVLSNAMERVNKMVSIPKDLQSYFNGAKEVSFQDFNKVYSNAINAKKFMNAAQFKSDSSLFGRLFGLWAGESLGQELSPGIAGKIGGGAIGELVSSHLLPAAKFGAEEALKAGSKAVTVPAKGFMGLTAPTNNP